MLVVINTFYLLLNRLFIIKIIPLSIITINNLTLKSEFNAPQRKPAILGADNSPTIAKKIVSRRELATLL